MRHLILKVTKRQNEWCDLQYFLQRLCFLSSKKSVVHFVSVEISLKQFKTVTVKAVADGVEKGERECVRALGPSWGRAVA